MRLHKHTTNRPESPPNERCAGLRTRSVCGLFRHRHQVTLSMAIRGAQMSAFIREWKVENPVVCPHRDAMRQGRCIVHAGITIAAAQPMPPTFLRAISHLRKIDEEKFPKCIKMYRNFHVTFCFKFRSLIMLRTKASPSLSPTLMPVTNLSK